MFHLVLRSYMTLHPNSDSKSPENITVCYRPVQCTKKFIKNILFEDAIILLIIFPQSSRTF